MLLNKLVTQLNAVRNGPLPDHVLAQVRTLTLNALACAFDGMRDADASAVSRLVAAIAGPGPSTQWITGRGLGPLDATFANAMYGSPQQDMHPETVTHPGTFVIPAALAVAERIGASGAAYAGAVVAGYEAVGQIGRIAATATFFERGWRAPSVFGTFGSAAAGATLLELNREATVNALALAGNVAGGVCAYKSSGTGEGALANATGARNGLEAAFLAASGLRAAKNLLEAPLGFLTAFSGGTAEDIDRWPRPGARVIEGVYIKPFDSCAYNQESIEAMRRLVRRYRIRAADVRRAVTSSYAKTKHHRGCDNPGPFAGVTRAVGSCQFGMAAVLLDGGELTAERYSNYDDPAIAELSSRIAIEVDPEAERVFPQVKRSTVIVELADGRRLEQCVDDLAYPAASDVASRFLRVASPMIGAEAAAEVVDRVGQLELLSSITEITAPLRHAGVKEPRTPVLT